MSKRKTGLHKRISSIFDGVAIHKEGGVSPPLDKPEKPGHLPPTPKPLTPADKTAAKPLVPQLPTQLQPAKPQPPVQPPKPAAPKQTEPAVPAPHKQPEPAKPQPVQPQPVQPPKPAAPKKTEPAVPVPHKQPEPARQVSQKPPKIDIFVKALKQPPWQQLWKQIENRFLAPKPGVNPAKQKTMVLLVPTLFIALIFALTRLIGSSPHKATNRPKPGPADAAAATKTRNNWQIPQPWPTTLRDPMQFGSLTAAQGKAGKLIVRGIVYTKDSPSAVIGNKIVREGDELFGVLIVKINKNSVEFELEGNRWTQDVQN